MGRRRAGNASADRWSGRHGRGTASAGRGGRYRRARRAGRGAGRTPTASAAPGRAGSTAASAGRDGHRKVRTASAGRGRQYARLPGRARGTVECAERGGTRDVPRRRLPRRAGRAVPPRPPSRTGRGTYPDGVCRAGQGGQYRRVRRAGRDAGGTDGVCRAGPAQEGSDGVRRAPHPRGIARHRGRAAHALHTPQIGGAGPRGRGPELRSSRSYFRKWAGRGRPCGNAGPGGVRRPGFRACVRGCPPRRWAPPHAMSACPPGGSVTLLVAATLPALFDAVHHGAALSALAAGSG